MADPTAQLQALVGATYVGVELDDGDPANDQTVGSLPVIDYGVRERLDDALAAAAGSVLDVGNSSLTALTADQEVFGDWIDTSSMSALLPLAFGLAALDTFELQWSSDGVSPRTDPIATTGSDLTDDLTEAGGAFVYLGSPASTMIDQYVRVHLINGPVAQTTGFYSHALWRYHGSSYPFTIQNIDATLSSLSTALLARVIPAGVDPDDNFKNTRVQGRSTANSTSTPLGPDEVWRGEWIEWQDNYIKLLVDAFADVSGTAYLDFSEDETPVDGDDTSITDSLAIAYDPAATPLLRRHAPVQSRWARARYVNGPVPQAEFQFDTAFAVTDPGLILGPASSAPLGTYLAGLVQNIGYLLDDAGDYQPATIADDGGQRVSIAGQEAEVDIGSPSTFSTKAFNVGSDSPTLVSLDLGAGARSVLIFNDGTGKVWFAPNASDVAASSRRFPIPAQYGVPFEIEGPQTIAFLAQDLGGTTTDTELDGAGTANNSGVTSPGNLLASDDAHAEFDTTADSVDITGFTAQRTGAEVSTVELKLEGRKSPTAPATQQATFVDAVTNTAGNVGSITSPAVTANDDHFYLASITRRNGSAAINSVTGMGLTWSVVADITDDSGSNRISVYKASGTPTAGTVQAIFSVTATNCTITVSRFAGVTDVDQFETLGTAGSSGSYSDSLTGTDRGLLAVFATSARRTHTPGSGSTEQADFGTGTGPNDSRSVVTTRELSATGAAAYSGTWSAAADWALVAVTLTPRPSLDPEVTVTYDPGDGTGPTSLVATLTATTDATFTEDVTADRAWDFDDIDATELTVTATDIGAAPAEIDRVWLHVVEVEAGNTQRIAILEVGED